MCPWCSGLNSSRAVSECFSPPKNLPSLFIWRLYDVIFHIENFIFKELISDSVYGWLHKGHAIELSSSTHKQDTVTFRAFWFCNTFTPFLRVICEINFSISRIGEDLEAIARCIWCRSYGFFSIFMDCYEKSNFFAHTIDHLAVG